MNKQLIYTAGTFVIGAVTGALVLDKVWTNRFNREIDVIANDIREDYARFYAGQDGKPSLQSLIDGSGYSEKEEAKEVATVEEAASASAAREHVTYNTMYQGDSSDHPIMNLDKAQSLVDKTSAQTQPIKDALAEEGPDEDDDDDIEHHNVFEDNPMPPDYDDRKNGGTYILTTEEFMEEPKQDGYTTVGLTWFEDGDTLIDESDQSIVPAADTIGVEATKYFGWDPKSDDEHTIFVRNEKSEIDFEVTRDERSYAEVILGFDEEDVQPHRKYSEDD